MKHIYIFVVFWGVLRWGKVFPTLRTGASNHVLIMFPFHPYIVKAEPKRVSRGLTLLLLSGI